MSITPNGYGLGWRPQFPDHRDFVYSTPPHISTALPDFVDLRKEMPPIYDQLRLGSCTANAVAGCLQYKRMKQKLPEGQHVPSRLAIYYGTRQMEGTIYSDAGGVIRDAIKYIAKRAVPFEDGPNSWPYNISKFRELPTPGLFRDQDIEYKSIPQNLQQIRGCLAEGWPIAFGFVVYAGLDDPNTAVNDFSNPLSGRLMMPKANEAPLGGHATVIVGYDHPNQTFLIRNSWSEKWGLRGYFLADYSYILRPDLSSDFWTIRSQEKV